MFLATTALETFWHDTEEILFLGPHCLIQRNAQSHAYHNPIFVPSIWKNTTDTDKAIKRCNEIYANLLPVISNTLNTIHGINKSQHYYHILLGNWLEGYIHQYYDKYHSIQRAVHEYSNLFTYTLDQEQYYTPYDFNDYHDQVCDDHYALQLYSRIINYLGIPSESKMPTATLCYAPSSSYSHPIKNAIHFCSDWTNRHLSKHRIVFATPSFKTSKFLNRIKLWIKSRGLIVFDDFSYPLQNRHSVNKHLRHQYTALIAENNQKNFENFLFSVIFLDLPVIFLEDYHAICQQVFETKLPVPDAMVTMNALHTNMFYKIFLAEHYEKTSHFSIQHGAGYGLDAYNYPERYESSVSSVFFTWGWCKDPRTRVLPQPPRVIKRKKPHTALFIINEMPRYVYRLHYAPMADQYITISLANALEFFAHVNSYDDMLIRSYPLETYKWHTIDRLRKEFPLLRMDDLSVSYNDRLKEAKVVLSNHIGTTFLEAMQANIPTIIFLSQDIYKFNAKAQSYIDTLSEVGVIHYSALDAAEHYTAVSSNIEAWWQQKDVQEARENFCAHYALTDVQWVKTWVEQFKSAVQVT